MTLCFEHFTEAQVSDRHTTGQIPSAELINPFTITQNHDRIELYGKFGYLGFEDLSKSVGFIADFGWHNLDSYYGNKHHHGVQKNVYLSSIFSNGFDESAHHLDMGVSYTYDDYNSQLDDIDLSRIESVPGAFIEYTFLPNRRDCETEGFVKSETEKEENKEPLESNSEPYLE